MKLHGLDVGIEEEIDKNYSRRITGI